MEEKCRYRYNSTKGWYKSVPSFERDKVGTARKGETITIRRWIHLHLVIIKDDIISKFYKEKKERKEKSALATILYPLGE